MARLDDRIYIQKQDLSKGLLYLVWLLPFTFALLSQVLHLPAALRYCVDVLLAAAVVMSLSGGTLAIQRQKLALALTVGVMVLYNFINYLFHFQSPFYLLWGMRNNFRFFLAFFAFSSYFTQHDAGRCLKLLDGLFWINAAVCVVQASMGYRQDYLGGIFGTEKGGNGYLIVFMAIVVCKSVLSYMNGTEGMFSCFLKSAASLLIAAVGELKAFFILFIIIVFAAMLLTSFSLRKVLLLLAGSIMVTVAAAVLGTLFTYFEDFLSLERLGKMLLMENYASDMDMGRFSAIKYINRRFLKEPWERIVGLGMGNCDTSSLALFNTQFYNHYVDTHYSIFSYAFMYLETGFVGLGLYVLFFVQCFVMAMRKFLQKKGELLYSQMAVVMVPVALALMVYNSSLRTEAGYMVFFVLALPLMEPIQEQKEGEEL